jgi:hypothetical protein
LVKEINTIALVAFVLCIVEKPVAPAAGFYFIPKPQLNSGKRLFFEI